MANHNDDKNQGGSKLPLIAAGAAILGAAAAVVATNKDVRDTVTQKAGEAVATVKSFAGGLGDSLEKMQATVQEFIDNNDLGELSKKAQDDIKAKYKELQDKIEAAWEEAGDNGMPQNMDELKEKFEEIKASVAENVQAAKEKAEEKAA